MGWENSTGDMAVTAKLKSGVGGVEKERERERERERYLSLGSEIPGHSTLCMKPLMLVLHYFMCWFVFAVRVHTA